MNYHSTSKSTSTGPSSSSNSTHYHNNTGRPLLTSNSSSSTSITTSSMATSTTTTKKVLDTPFTNHASYQQHSSPSVHVYSYQGQLHYHGHVYQKGDQFTVVDANSGRYNAKLLSATETEVHIQRTDGSKTKLPFIQMSRGKYSIYPKHS
ncbi:hypothetical protein BDA99DRAFT_268707 [Phascolomyces articulosus]|uniref:Uncharacterized protein n=1 Tax=Phascolomyces articulosus TaxID=60185 RepID=A0AAD5JXZ3_9FUNG|nr:hypothetical protein BDA99DRAFT_268707 [Phascolomyces articulosus]